MGEERNSNRANVLVVDSSASSSFGGEKKKKKTLRGLNFGSSALCCISL